MPTITTDEAIRTTQEHILSAVRQSQEAMVKAVTVWSQAVAKAVPELPSQPLADKLPTPEKLVETSFQFAEKLLGEQHKFVTEVLAAAAPVMKKTGASNGSKSDAKAS
ncbi:MAG: hypothetical protein M3R39_09595 [Actinomycetota bacterium]|nr:hypothetical protein [Actinomycetota bacterium]